jgi:hypothetical protein
MPASPKPKKRPERHLLYTIAIDPPGSPGHRTLAKMLVSSLLKTWFTGDIVVFRNTSEPLFQVPRQGVTEYEIETPDYHGVADEQEAWRYKFRVREHLKVKGYDKVVFLDADCLALRNIDHLLEGEWDIGWYPEPGRSVTLPQFHCFLTDGELRLLKSRMGANSGSLAIRAERYHEVMEAWEKIDLGPTKRPRECSDQASWNRFLLDTPLKKHPFEKGEIQFPLFLHPSFHEWKNAALVHAIGGMTREKMRFLWGLYIQTFYFDDRATMLNLIEM